MESDDEEVMEATATQSHTMPQTPATTQQCLSCGGVWCDGDVCEGCAECGGHALTRPCPVCMGQCGAVWRRNISMSHSFHKAFWDGECALNEEQKAAHLLRIMVEPDQDELAEAMQDLGT